MIDPCFSCALPDCDETSVRCARQRALKAARRKKKAGAELTETELLVYREYLREWRQAKRERDQQAVHG
ncbi:MAG: hypothetical protein K8H74_18035 [Notoacmeibacter sp.]|nr:hypothetical protein [Notoacmeibacter sp.]